MNKLRCIKCILELDFCHRNKIINRISDFSRSLTVSHPWYLIDWNLLTKLFCAKKCDSTQTHCVRKGNATQNRIFFYFFFFFQIIIQSILVISDVDSAIFKPTITLELLFGRLQLISHCEIAMCVWIVKF